MQTGSSPVTPLRRSKSITRSIGDRHNAKSSNLWAGDFRARSGCMRRVRAHSKRVAWCIASIIAPSTVAGPARCWTNLRPLLPFGHWSGNHCAGIYCESQRGDGNYEQDGPHGSSPVHGSVKNRHVSKCDKSRTGDRVPETNCAKGLVRPQRQCLFGLLARRLIFPSRLGAGGLMRAREAKSERNRTKMLSTRPGAAGETTRAYCDQSELYPQWRT